MFRELIFRIQPLFRRRTLERELAEELQAHLELATEANVAAGMTPTEARRAAERELGRLEAIKQDYRDERGISWVEHSIQDLRYGTRMVRKAPWFTATIVATLALGIGINTALFSALNALLLRPLPVHEPHRLVGLFRKAATDRSYHRVSYPDYAALRDRNRSFTGLAAYNFTPVHFSAAGNTSRIWGQLVTPNYFSVLGINLLLGAGFTDPHGKTLEARPEVVLSHALWKNRLGADSAIVGRSLTLNGVSFVVVGVAPEAFSDLESWLAPAVWVPMAMQPRIVPGSDWLHADGYSWLRVIGRLRPGVTLAQAQAEASTLATQVAQERGPHAALTGVTLVPDVRLHPEIRPVVRGYLLMLMGAAGIVLMLVCVNLTTLWLARSMTRWKEMGTRLALGATRGRLFRQMITESVMVALAGGALALALAPLLLRGIEALQAASTVPSPVNFGLDVRVLTFSAAVSVLTGLLFGSVPAWCAARTDILDVMKYGSPHRDAKPAAWRNGFVAIQIAASIVLLVCAGLLLRSLHRSQRIDPGFDTDRLLVVTVDVGLQGYSAARGRTFFEDARRRIHHVAGVESASIGHMLPLSPWREDRRVWFDSAKRPSDEQGTMVNFDIVDEGYFDTTGIPLSRGRGFAASDLAGGEPVAIVNETLARMIAPDGEALNRTLRLSPGGSEHRIVGIARDSKYVTLREPPQPFVYLPFAQHYRAAATLIVRARTNPGPLVQAVTQAVQEIDADLPVYRAGTMNEHVSTQLFVPQWAAILLMLFAGVAVLLAFLGVFGVTACGAAQRQREFGVRIAFGAQRTDIVALMVGGSVRLLAFGTAVGLLLSIAAALLLRSLLYEVGPLDAPSFLLAVVAVSAATLLACYLPARRATVIPPTEALRHE